MSAPKAEDRITLLEKELIELRALVSDPARSIDDVKAQLERE